MTEGKVNQSHGSGNLSDSHSSESLDELWLAANPDLDALNDIIAAHFGVQCVSREVLGRGGYAFAYLVTLANDVRVVARVILPVRDYVKTEAEVATMTSVRGSLGFQDIYVPHTDHRQQYAHRSRFPKSTSFAALATTRFAWSGSSWNTCLGSRWSNVSQSYRSKARPVLQKIWHKLWRHCIPSLLPIVDAFPRS